MKKILFPIMCILLLSCSTKEQPKEKYRFTVRTTEDNNWSTSGEYKCDSVRPHGTTKMDIWTDGRMITIYSKQIRCFQNY